MIVYLADKAKFLDDVDGNGIAEIIEKAYFQKTGKRVAANEMRSWSNSLVFMERIVKDATIPSNAGIAIEFQIPRTNNRVDFIITGLNASSQKSVVIVELKQWSDVEKTEKDAVVRTFLNGAKREANHPSYQAWSYAALMQDFNESVEMENVQLSPCAYLHNCESDGVIQDARYKEHTDRAPAFLKSDAKKLRDFIRSHIKHGDNGEALYILENGKIRPSKNLADSLSAMLKGKQEFVLIDDQKIVYETGLSLTRQASESLTKRVFIINGGPGTGKTVVAINLLVKLTELGMVTQYVTKNSAPRSVYEYRLAGTMKKSRISNMFTGSGSFTNSQENIFDALVVDEAHRLNAKSGMFQNLGENQIMEIIKSAKCAIFFIDEDQRVTLKDIGTKEEIVTWAKRLKAPVEEMTLKSQFRCNGSNGYLSWVDDVLGIRETANETLDGISYDFRVCESPVELRRLIIEANRGNNKSRMVAGYCWPWASKKDPRAFDIVMKEHGFAARWNLADDGMLWIVSADSVNEVGCIHTCQGLDLDFVGVILGPDFLIRNGVIVTDAAKRAKADRSVFGYKSLLKTNPEKTKARADAVIKNTYRTLMTRGIKGCFVYSVDPETNEYFKQRSLHQTPPKALS